MNLWVNFEATNVWDWLDHQPKLPILNTHFIPFIANSPQTEAWDSCTALRHVADTCLPDNKSNSQ